MRRVAAAVLLVLLSAGCSRMEVVRYCEACFEKDGLMLCGKAYTNVKREPDVTEEGTKLLAGQDACTEWAARKGGGYAGPLFHEARAQCAKEVKLEQLRRVRCEDKVTKRTWSPRDGSDAL